MPRSLTSVEIDVSDKPQPAVRTDSDTPFRILVAGNFSGGPGRLRKPIPVDRDNFDDVLELLAPQLEVSFAGETLPLSFYELEDFHPDRLYEKLPFDNIREQPQQPQGPPPKSQKGQPAPPRATPARSGADLLSEMLDEEPSPAAAPARARGEWEQMLHDITAPYTVPKPDPREEIAAAHSDRVKSAAMRSVLHGRKFQALEAAWRGLWFLVRRLETSTDLKIFVLDLPYEELITAAGVATLRRLVVDEASGTPGADPWAVIAGMYYFEPSDEAALIQIAAIARAADAPFLSGVGPDVVGLEPAFEDLRRSRDAAWVGLAMPRFLLRLPYGSETSSIETFGFEEMPAAPQHQWYLWGNPAIACAYLMGEAFRRFGWRMRPGAVSEIEGLPAHTYQADGESKIKPCAEVLLTEEAAELLMDQGLMPLLSIKGSDRVRLARFQSVALPAAALGGRWGE